MPKTGPRNDTLDHAQFITMKQAAQLLGISETHLRRWQHAGQFIKCRRIGANSVRLLRSEFEAWVASRPVIERSASDDQL